jgi:CRISPR-associated protein Csb1
MQKLTIEMIRAMTYGMSRPLELSIPVRACGDNRVSPPTFASDGSSLALGSKRLPDGGKTTTVVLDSVARQARRMKDELAMLQDDGAIEIPDVQLVVRDAPAAHLVGIHHACQMPHGLYDKALTTQLLGGKAFDRSPIARAIDQCHTRDMTAIFEHQPSQILFGGWYSWSPTKKSAGFKFARALQGEIHASGVEVFNATAGMTDKFQLSSNVDFARDRFGHITIDPDLAVTEPMKLSASGHGGPPPSISDRQRVSFVEARHDLHLSLARLNRYRFPVDGVATHKTDNAARVVLVALGFVLVACLVDSGWDLRSDCELDMVGDVDPVWTKGGTVVADASDANDALAVYHDAVEAAREVGFKLDPNPVQLDVSPAFAQAIEKSWKKIVEGDGK